MSERENTSETKGDCSLCDNVLELASWKCPKKSGLVFGVGTLSYLLTVWGGYSVVTLISYVLLVHLCVCFVWSMTRAVVAAEETSTDGVEEYVSREMIDAYLDDALLCINTALTKAGHIFRSTDPAQFAMWCVTLYMAAIFGKILSGLTLLYLAFFTVFVCPPVYEHNKEQIDPMFLVAKKYVSQAKKEAMRGLMQVADKLPPNVQAMLHLKKD